MAAKMVVIDASVAVKWFLQETGRAEAMALQADGDLLAPELIVAEVLNAIWRNIRAGSAPQATMSIAATRLVLAFVRLVSIADLAARAGEIAVTLDHPAYDCFYLALAEREGVDLITADKRLTAKTRGTAFEASVRPLMP